MSFFVLLTYIALSLLRPWELIPALAPYRIAFWLGNLGLVVSTLRFLASGQFEIFQSPEFYTLFSFIGILVISPALAVGDYLGVVEALFRFMTSFLACVLVFLNVDSIRKVRVLSGTLVASAVMLVFAGIAAYHFGWNYEVFVMGQRSETANEMGERVAIGRVRGLGFLNDPNDLSQALLAFAPLLWPRWRKGGHLRNFCVVVLPTLLLIYGSLLTKSRGGVLTILVIVVLRLRERMTSFRNVGPVILAGVLGVAMLAAGVTGGRSISSDDESADGRLEAWYAGLQMLQSSPLTGVGFMNFTDHHGLTAHNSYVLCFAELGLLGYFAWLATLILIHSRMKALGDVETDDPDVKDLAEWATAVRFAFYGFLTSAFFLSRTYTPTLYILVGIAMAVHLMGVRLENEDRTASLPSLYARSALVTISTVFAVAVIIRFR